MGRIPSATIIIVLLSILSYSFIILEAQHLSATHSSSAWVCGGMPTDLFWRRRHIRICTKSISLHKQYASPDRLRRGRATEAARPEIKDQCMRYAVIVQPPRLLRAELRFVASSYSRSSHGNRAVLLFPRLRHGWMAVQVVLRYRHPRRAA